MTPSRPGPARGHGVFLPFFIRALNVPNRLFRRLLFRPGFLSHLRSLRL
jgi:hypothetical protein